MEKKNIVKCFQLVVSCVAFFSAVPTQAEPTSHLRYSFTVFETELVWKILQYSSGKNYVRSCFTRQNFSLQLP